MSQIRLTILSIHDTLSLEQRAASWLSWHRLSSSISAMSRQELNKSSFKDLQIAIKLSPVLSFKKIAMDMTSIFVRLSMKRVQLSTFGMSGILAKTFLKFSIDMVDFLLRWKLKSKWIKWSWLISWLMIPKKKEINSN